MSTKNRVVLVEDSPVALEILQRLLKSSPDVDVVGIARNGAEGLEVINRTHPDVICTDFMMENMDGLELTQRVMAENPRPILVVSNFVQKTDVDNVYRLLQAGAADVFPKPSTESPTDYEKLKAALVTKIKILSGMKVSKLRSQPSTPTVKPIISGSFSANQPQIITVTSRIKVITIGASTGSLQAIGQILKSLPINFPLPIICTLHVNEGVLSGLVKWLLVECALQVKIATPGDAPAPGTVYFAPENSNLELDLRGRFVYSHCPEKDKHCPSISAMFRSVAQFYGGTTAAVLLSGIGNDGAEGLQTISQAGGITVAQEGNFGMVKEAMGLGAVQQALAVERIAPFLIKTISS